MNWQPTASFQTLKKRAEFMAQVRQFFDAKKVMEVETPLLSHGTVTDVHLEGFKTDFLYSNTQSEPQSLYLQTSPEFAMKRLLAAGSGSIFQICKSFRNEEAGRFHNPEFTMLEWYRPYFDDHALMDELNELIQVLLGCSPAIKMSYQQAFLTYLNIDPLSASFEQIKSLVLSFSNDNWLKQTQDKNTLLQWLFSMKIEPVLGKAGGKTGGKSAGKTLINNLPKITPCFVYDFPASQAALARINKDDNRVAHRFELYFNGVELANGFYELQDVEEQLSRFEQDNLQRQEMGLAVKPIDQHFLSALAHGLPDCAGVAVGLDRLFMLQQGLEHIEQAVSFSVHNA